MAELHRFSSRYESVSFSLVQLKSLHWSINLVGFTMFYTVLHAFEWPGNPRGARFETRFGAAFRRFRTTEPGPALEIRVGSQKE